MLKSDLRGYFKERLVEMFDNSTLDSYRVRVNNAFTLLIEARDTINGRIDNRIKSFITVRPCLNELLISLNSDDCLTYSACSKDKTIKLIKDFIGQNENQKEDFTKYPFILFIIERIIRDNKSIYLATLFKKITDILNDNTPLLNVDFEKEVNIFDSYILSMGCQLIYNGYSKTHLYFKAKELLQSTNFMEDYEAFRDESLASIKERYYVVLKVNFSARAFNNGEIPGFVKELDNEETKHYLADIRYLQNFLRTTKFTRFYISEVEALDGFSAMMDASDRLATILDQINLGMTTLKATAADQGLAVIRKTDGTYEHKYGRYHRFDDSYIDDVNQVLSLQKSIKSIQEQHDIREDVKDRLTSAFRHLRIANYSTELEEKFLNYWIALEFVFSSPVSSENTFTRMKEHLSSILYCCYAKRNLQYLNFYFQKKGILADNEFFWLKNDTDLSTFINSQTSLLIKYRLIRMKEHFLSGDKKRHEYMDQHLSNIKEHLARIYRLRNELVHEAAIKQKIQNVTSNLRYYLVFSLNQMICYFGQIPLQGKTMDDFFNEYQLIKIKLSQEENISVHDLVNVPFEHRLLA